MNFVNLPFAMLYSASLSKPSCAFLDSLNALLVSSSKSSFFSMFFLRRPKKPHSFSSFSSLRVSGLLIIVLLLVSKVNIL
jgi:hypothetical protein